VEPQAARLAFRSEAKAGSEIEKDIRGLRDNELSRLEIRRREHLWLVGRVLVEVGGTGILEREPNELAAPLDGGPVIELVAHAPKGT
jgi:hypothetical protein